MIIFETVRYKNFLSTGNDFIELRLNEHASTLIVGQNGAGKTTCLEAIYFALYGKSLRNINKPNLINSITGKNLLVELEFTISGAKYLIRRGHKPGIFEIYKNEKLLDQDAASGDYQTMLEDQILKIKAKSFSQIVTLSMANYTPFMKLTTGDRRKVIEDLLDIQIFSVMNQLLKDRVSSNKEAITAVEYDVKLLENKIELHKKHLLELNRNNKDLINERKAKIAEQHEQIHKYAEQISAFEKEVQALQDGLVVHMGSDQELAQATQFAKRAKALRKTIQTTFEFYETNTSCPTCSQQLDQHFKDSKIKECSDKLETIDGKIPELERQISELTNRVGEVKLVNGKICELNKKISNVAGDITTANKLITALTADIESLLEKVEQVKSDNSVMIALQEQIENSVSTKNDLISEREVLNLAGALLKDGGIKTRVIKQYIPIMNKLINNYLAKMDFFVQFELDETFKETIKSRYRDEFSYESFSQGEKLRIDLALMFSWRAIAKMRNSASTNLLFMDEILDSSLDTSGVDEFLKIIKGLTSDTNLFIISHRGDQLVDKFDNVLKFEKKHNFSRLIK